MIEIRITTTPSTNMYTTIHPSTVVFFQNKSSVWIVVIVSPTKAYLNKEIFTTGTNILSNTTQLRIKIYYAIHYLLLLRHIYLFEYSTAHNKLLLYMEGMSHTCTVHAPHLGNLHVGMRSSKRHK